MIAIESSILNQIEKIVGSKYLITKSDLLYNYSKDCTSNKEVVPSAVVLPKNTQEISDIITLCNETKTSVTVRGGGTGVSGGALSNHKGIILSLERLNNIIEINKVDRIAIVESGVITQDLRDAALKEGLNFPQNISSASSCFIGGNVAVASGSPKSLKYGTTKNYVVNLEVVLPDGSIIWTGKNVSKNATGYNFTQLITGSEGTLGIITKVVLKLVPPMKELVFMVPFTNINNLFKCVKHFFEKGYSASSIEFIDAVGFRLASQFLDNTFHTTSDVQGVLWIELEGEYPEKLMDRAIEIGEFVNLYTKEEVHIADTPTEVKKLWEMRSKVGEAVINHTFFRDVDIVVPRSKVDQMYEAIVIIASKYNFDYTVFGHIGDGNFHVNIFQRKQQTIEEWENNIAIWVKEIFLKALELGGTISGEHGIGKTNLPYIEDAISSHQLELMKNIKTLFDRNEIIN
ncbi:FAD-binding oxidoreductase [Tenacibaculum ascidiaceicola]|uniref:FAD-binding oxidoreductase n=1 Tax=Tenacibaculum ascidiaceicola TaxID=1699411 RepID=UPI003CE4A614